MRLKESQSRPAARPSGPIARDFAWLFLSAILLLALVAAADYLTLPPWLTLSSWQALPLRLLRLFLGLAFVLYLPGYCLMAALFPAAAGLDNIERLGLSLALSVAWVPVLALILDRLPWGLRLWPILLGETASMLAFVAIALWRRARLPQAEIYLPNLGWRPRPWWRALSPPDKRIYKICVVVLSIALLAAAWIFLVPSPDEFMTEFYILGEAGLAENYPRQAAPGQPLSVTLGITNRERAPISYHLQLWAVDPWNDRRQLVNTAGPFALDPGQAIRLPITWSMPWPGDDQQLLFYLFTHDGPAATQQATVPPYRQLRLWLNVTPE